MSATAVKTVQVDGLRLAYRELGQGPPVLLLHGWPTSSFLWRNVMGSIARANRAVALDLPGFGASDKPVGIRYSFDFFGRALDQFLAHVGIDQLGLAVHDLGGPVGLHWALGRPGRLTKLALLNTLVYPEFSEAVKEFARLRQPGAQGEDHQCVRPGVAYARRARRCPKAHCRRARRRARALPHR
ncbi:MAG TPA: alpha/beta fold hydrolase [Candidatus Dormibacteraeota bacterium]|jgi:haloalkane dehalogenase|nr:alpha/beta fold hydrolase [Candidatus Dormibacteraeota bacterium]